MARRSPVWITVDNSKTRGRTAGKQPLREKMWGLLTRRRVARFPLPLNDRIPNFAGAERAAERLAALPEWRRARVLKCNPDAPQRPVRLRALREGKQVYVAVPRLREARCFLCLDPRTIPAERLAAAATIGGAAALGVPVTPEALPHVDLVVAGSVAVNRRGARVGKGGGYSDLEFALAAELGAVDARTRVVTTVHDLQVVAGAIPMTGHDVPVDLIVTPTRVLRPRRGRRPRGIRWDELDAAQLAAMPAVAAHRERGA
jgi:5-formyltetrahydrofolate cyclo-ligase